MNQKRFTTRIIIMIPLLLLLLVGSRIFLDTASANPGDYFVSSTGSGTECTPVAPCDLTTALQNAVDNDHVYLAEGNYTGTGSAVISLTQDITLHGGWDGSTTMPVVLNPHQFPTVLDGQDSRRVVDISGGAAPVLIGLTITNGYGDYSGGGVRSVSSHPTIQECIIKDNHADGDGGGIILNGGSAQIVKNRILDNTGHWAGALRVINNAQASIRGNYISSNTASNSVGGIDIDCCGGSTVIVEQNWIVDNSGGAYGGGVAVKATNATLVNNIIARNSAGEGAGVYTDGTESYPADIEMTNNTISGLSSSDQAVWVNGVSTADFTNNILTSFAVGISISHPMSSTVTADHNLFWNLSDPLLGTNAVQADPLLDAHDHLTSLSPAIDAGNNVSLSIDIDGDPRPSAAFDIGADEFYNKVYLPLINN